MKLSTKLLTGAVLVALMTTTASATEIVTLGPNDAGSYWVWNYNPTIELTTSGPLSGPAYLGSEVGTYTLGTFPIATAGAQDAQGNYPVDIQQPLTISLPNLYLNGTAEWQTLEDPPTVAVLVGDFQGDLIDLTLSAGLPAPDVHADLGISTGELLVVPEPSTWWLLAAALGGFFGMRRWRA